MIYKILTVILIVLFYIIRLPFVIIKDIVLAIYSAFDTSRFLETYQNTLANFICISSILKKTFSHNLSLEDNEDESGEECKTVGFKTMATGLETPQSPTEAGIINDKRD